ncbi:sugar phosphate isomerase/epimerase family protein [Tunicatimonas pelagia]|uniref:sugar phosphate isomerase/epimerase family protein n=1 Tax=Tunicatimonas pelagia TaxID=931531 RepID=UPI002665ADD8|nr:sugar phosphate isomerase/epimerase family protein [Tunicatimonas pelagia]WKN43324.1 sugar phosphate isomerase/epimerase [Tunicatimonas pelagia]
MQRRKFLSTTAQASLGAWALPSLLKSSPLFFKMSLAEWSLRQPIRKGAITNLDFPRVAKEFYGIDAVEYVNQFFIDKVKDQVYLKELKQRADDLGVTNVLIMLDLWEYPTASPAESERIKSAEKHYEWIDAAHTLGCHGVRINANGYEGKSPEEAADLFVDTLVRLADYGKAADMNIMVENHGNYSSNGKWLAMVMEKANRDNVGTLPDFGNTKIAKNEDYDRYQLVKELMPYAKGVSAKTVEFNSRGKEVNMDYEQLMAIVKEADFTGYVGIEFGGKLEEINKNDGVMLTKKLLQKVGGQLS